MTPLFHCGAVQSFGGLLPLPSCDQSGKREIIEFQGAATSFDDTLPKVFLRTTTWASSRSNLDNIRIEAILHNWEASLFM